MPRAFGLSGPTVSKYLCTSDIVSPCVVVRVRVVETNGCSPSTKYGTSLFVIDNLWYQPYPVPGLRLTNLLGPINLYLYSLAHWQCFGHGRRPCLVKAYCCELLLSLNLPGLLLEVLPEVTWLDKRV